MTCERVKERLDGYLDDELTEAEFQEMELHLADCPGCREDERQLRAVVALAAALPRERQPARDLWEGIAGRIGARTASWARPSAWWAAGLAAAATVAVVAWLSPLWPEPGSPPAQSPLAGTRPAAALPGAAGLDEAEREYERATAELMAALGERRVSLSPDTAALVDENLRVIDEALVQVRAALARDPASPRLSRMLASTHEKKIETLKRVLKLTT